MKKLFFAVAGLAAVALAEYLELQSAVSRLQTYRLYQCEDRKRAPEQCLQQ